MINIRVFFSKGPFKEIIKSYDPFRQDSKTTTMKNYFWLLSLPPEYVVSNHGTSVAL